MSDEQLDLWLVGHDDITPAAEDAGESIRDLSEEVAVLNAQMDKLAAKRALTGIAPADRGAAALASLRGDNAAAAAATASGDGGGSRGGLLAGLLAGILGSGSRLGGNGGGVGGAVGFGGGGQRLPLGILGLGVGLAAPFSLAAMAGFGLEHVLTTLLGLAGSLAGAFGGLAAIAVGSFGVMAVGMGSDMLVLRSTLADTQQLSKAYDAVSKAVAVYGANSTQAKTAQADLNYLMETLGNTAGVKAEAQLAQSLSNLNNFWDQATSTARVKAVQMMMPFVDIAHGFIPLIADAAARNFQIIHDNLGGLIAFLNGPGHTVFQDLEDTFAHNLPTAVDAFTQGIEFVLNTLDYLRQYVGGAVQAIDKFLHKMNDPQGFNSWTSRLRELMNLFGVWKNFVVTAVHTVFDIFSNDKGLGTGIIQSLTAMLQRLNAWLETVNGKQQIGGLFEAHKEELLAILRLLPALSPLAELYIKIATPLSFIVADMARFIEMVAGAPMVGPLLEWGLAIAFIASKVKLLAIIGGMFKLLGLLATGIQIAGMAAGGATVEMGALAISMDGVAIAGFAIEWPIILIIAAIALLVVGIILLVTHFQQVVNWIHQGSVGVRILEGALIVLLGPIGLVIVGIMELVAHFKEIVNWASKLPVVGGMFKGLADRVNSSNKSVSDSSSSMSSSVSTDFGSMKDNVLGSMSQMNGGVNTNFDQMANYGTDKSQWLGDNVNNDFSSMNQRTNSNLTSMRQNLISEFQQQFGQGSALTKQLSDNVTSNFDSMKDKGTTDAQLMEQNMIAQINQLYGQGTAQAQALVANVKSAFGDLPSIATAMGAAMARGLVDGMWSQIGYVRDIAQNVGNTAISGLRGNLSGTATDGVPRMAEGGLVTRPTLAIIGEAGPELVVPLNQINNGGLVRSFVPALAPVATGSGGGGENAATSRVVDALRAIAQALTRAASTDNGATVERLLRSIDDHLDAIRSESGGVSASSAVLRFGT